MHTTASLLTALAGGTIVLASPAPAPPRPLITARPIRPLPNQRLDARQELTFTGEDTSWRSCFHDYTALRSGVPPQPTEVVEWIVTAVPTPISIDVENPNLTTITSMCDETAMLTPPASLSSVWSTYMDAVNSWADGQSSAVASLQSACPGEFSAIVGMDFATDAAECTAAVLEFVSFLQSSAGITPAEPTATKTTSSTGAPEPTGAAGGDKEETADDKTGDDNEGEGEGAGDDNNTPSTTQSTAGVAAARETGLVAAVAAVALGVAGVVAGF
jgi:hypothetical protein